MDPQQSIFEAVRQVCGPAIWSRAVELTRADAVVGEKVGADEAVFHVSTRGGMICPKVTLFPEELDWDCECSSHEPACEHVAAAVIAWRSSRLEGREQVVPKLAAGRVAYRFSRLPGGLALERLIVREGSTEPLETTLASLADGRVEGPRFLATRHDLSVEVVLGTHRRGLLPPQRMLELFRSLAHCPDLTLDRAPVRVESEPVLPRARLDDDADGFRLRLEQDPSVIELFDNGVALCGDTLRVVGDPRLTGAERHQLGQGRHFGPEAVAELVTRVLPGLRRRIPVDIRTSRLPETVQEKPRVVLDLTREGERLSVLATLVYGDPPLARIDAGRLVHLHGAVPLRDERAERGCLRRLRELGLAAGVRAEFDGEQAVAFNARLSGWSGGIRDAGVREYFELAPPLVPRVETGGGRFGLFFDSEAGAQAAARPAARRAEPAAVLRAWREGASLVPLTGGGWAPLPRDWLARFGHRVADLLAARDAEGGIPRAVLPDLARLCEELDQPPPPGLEGLKGLAQGFDSIPAAGLPDDLTAELRPYQRSGVDWLVFLREAGVGAMLADDMGLGKTVQALCAIRGRTLVVTPTSVLHNWANEIRAQRPGLSHGIYHGPRRRLDPDKDVTLTTYALLRLDADRLADESWDTVVLDEAQNIKNPESQVAAAAFRLRGGFRVTLTGTPVENRLDELWSQFHFINPGLLGGRGSFRERYAEPIARGEPEAAERLRRRIRPFVLRRLKGEVASDLPPRTEMVLHCELDEGEREVYDTIRAATLSEVVKRLGAGGSVMAALEALLRLRQAACHRGLIPGREAGHSTKLRVLLEALDSVVAEGHKALVFSQWTTLLDLTEPHLDAAGIPYQRLDGSTRNRAEVVRRFQTDETCPLMLVSLKAGGTGLNLTAADHIFMLDPWWNPAVEDQAADRAHRIGQERPVMIYRLVVLDTVEERILALQQRKRELAGAAMGEADRAAGLTRDDLLELLR